MFTHGVTGDHTLFEKQIDFWCKDYTVIVWDMPKHGESRNYKEFSFSNVADDMNQILEEEGISHIVMAGQSAGGYSVQAFIQKYPEKVDAFVSIDSTPFGLKYYKKNEIFWAKNYSNIARFYPYKFYCKSAAKSVSNSQAGQAEFYNCLERLGKKGMLEAADAVYKDFTNYDEVNFNCPVLLLLGDDDKTGYVKAYNYAWQKESGFPLKIIPHARHNSNYDNYEYFNNVVYEFLEKL